MKTPTSQALCAALGLCLAAAPLTAAQAQMAADSPFQPAKGCTTASAKAADPGDVAADPAAWAGKCVRLQGWWKDIGFYPTRAEAAVVDSLSIPLLDNRRIGLYLPKADLDAAPQGPKLATVVGMVGGACASLPAQMTAADTGYCHYKGGVFLAVRRIELAK